MIKVPSLALLIAGELLLADGLSAAIVPSSAFGQAVTDTPGSGGLALIAGGVIAVIAGGFGLNQCKAP